MYPANITREEAARRARQIRSHSYQVSVDLTGTADVPGGYDATATFWSRSAVRFASSGGASPTST